MSITKTKTTAKTVGEKLKAYKDFFSDINSLFFEREFEVNQIMYALMIREHVLLKGIPGAAKSEISRRVFGGMVGSRTYKAQFTRFMDEAYVFGPQLMDEFKKGIIRHNTKDSIVDADFAFLDELLNASEELISALNEVLNERTFTRQGQHEKSPLVTAIVTTNQDRESEKELRAFYDRMMFKSDVQELTDQTNRVKMYEATLSGKFRTQPEFDYDYLKDIHALIDSGKITFDSAMLNFYDMLITEYVSQSGVFISPRKKNKMLKIPIAAAALRGITSVDVECIHEIRYALVEGGNAKQMTYFDGVFSKAKQAFGTFDVVVKINKLFDETKQGKFDKGEKVKRYMGIKKKVEKLLGEVQGTPSAAALIKSLSDIQERAQKELDSIGELSDDDIFGGK
jgi:MoxR-like ATPase